MGWNGSGTFNRLYSWVADKAAGLDISSTRMDADSNDLASSGFGNCLTRDGQGQATANLPMANFRHTGVGDGVNRTDYSSLKQAQDGLVGWTVAGGSSDAITATYTPSRGAPSDGALYSFRAGAANATTTPTFAPDNQTAHTITRAGGTALQAGDIPGNLAECILRYNSANTRWELLNPAVATSSTASKFTRTILGGGTSGTYTTPTGVKYLLVRMAGAGGGGGGGANSAGGLTNGGTGGNTTFGSAFLTANGGQGGQGGSGGGGGTASGGDFNWIGAVGGPGQGAGTASGVTGAIGGGGGSSPWGGFGYGGFGGGNGNSATGTTGSGAGGGGGPTGTGFAGAGGASGGYLEKLIITPNATYAYSVGSGGAAGAAGTSGGAGGVGSGGMIIVEEYYS